MIRLLRAVWWASPGLSSRRPWISPTGLLSAAASWFSRRVWCCLLRVVGSGLPPLLAAGGHPGLGHHRRSSNSIHGAQVLRRDRLGRTRHAGRRTVLVPFLCPLMSFYVRLCPIPLWLKTLEYQRKTPFFQRFQNGISGDGGNRTPVQQPTPRSSPSAVCELFLSPWHHADLLPDRLS